MRHPFRLTLLIGLLASAAPARAADALAFGPVPTWVVANSVPADDGVTSSVGIRHLVQDVQFDFSPGVGSTFVERIARLQTPAGLAEAATLGLQWDPASQAVTIHKLHIVRHGQVIDVLAAGQRFLVLRRETNLENAALDGRLTATIQPIGLQIGDVIDFAFTVREADPVLRGALQEQAEVERASAIDHARVLARWPASMALHWRAGDAMAGAVVSRSGDRMRLSWTGENVQPLVQPTDAPARFRHRRDIAFSTFGGWADISRLFAPLYEAASRLQPGSPLLAEIARIRALSPDPVARAAAALALVQDPVHYVFIGMKDAGLVPASADLTWSRRFGDCKGKTVLLLALLHGLDIEAQPVLVSTDNGEGLDRRLPTTAFDHVLVRAAIANKVFWLDGTRTGDTALDRIKVPAFGWGLPITAQGSALIPMMPGPLDQPEITTTVRIDATGGPRIPAPFSVRQIVRGDGAIQLRLELANLTPADQDRRLRRQFAQDYDFVDFTAVQAAFDAASGEERLQGTGLARMEWNDGRYEADGVGVGYRADFDRPPGPDHDLPYRVDFPEYTTNAEAITLPDHGNGFTVQGDDQDTSVAGWHYTRHGTIDQGVFHAEASRRSLFAEIPAADAAGDAQAVLRDMARKTIYLREPGEKIAVSGSRVSLPEPPAGAAGDVAEGARRLDRGDWSGAIDTFNQALAVDPRNVYALVFRGLAERHNGDNSRARTDVDMAARQNPNLPWVLHAQGALAADAGDPHAAIVWLTKAIAGDASDTTGSLGLRAISYINAHEPDLALADFGQALQHHPTLYALRGLRAGILIDRGDFADANSEATAMVAASPKAPGAWIVAGNIFLRVNNFDDASDAAEQALTLRPMADAHLIHARARPIGDVAGRTADIDAALALEPASWQALSMREEMQMEHRDYPSALQTLGTWSKADGDSAELLVRRGVVHAKLGQAELAASDLAAARHAARTAVELNDVCWIEATANVALASALEECGAAVRKEPRNSGILDSRGFVLLRLHRYAEAVAAYSNALDVNPANAGSRLGRSIAERRAGDSKRAGADLAVVRSGNSRVEALFAGYGVAP